MNWLLLLALVLGMQTSFVSCSSEHDNPVVVVPDDQQEVLNYINRANLRETISDEERDALYAPFAWRLEVKDTDEMPFNFHWCGDEFNFETETSQELPEVGYVPSRQGLDDLQISGSARFTAMQLKQLCDWLKTKANGKPIYIVDLRNECHGFVNGHHMSQYGFQNWANIGKTKERIVAEENALFASLPGQTILYGKIGSSTNYELADSTWAEIIAEQTMTEEQAVTAMGLRYQRITALDHVFPTDQIIDSYLEFYHSLPQDCWLHFHCQAGRGRTTLYMSFTDMLRNPDVPLKDILYRQCLIGGSSMLNDGTGQPEWRVDLFKEISVLVPVLYEYVQDNVANGYSVPWSVWKKQKYNL